MKFPSLLSALSIFLSVIKDTHLSCTAVGLLAGVKSWLLLLLSHNFCTCKQVVIYLFFSLLDGTFHKLMICVHSFFSCSLHIELKFRNITSDGSTIIEGSSPLMSKFFVKTPTWRKSLQIRTSFKPILTNQLGTPSKTTWQFFWRGVGTPQFYVFKKQVIFGPKLWK